jgi:hypothetical protein
MMMQLAVWSPAENYSRVENLHNGAELTVDLKIRRALALGVRFHLPAPAFVVSETK